VAKKIVLDRKPENRYSLLLTHGQREENSIMESVGFPFPHQTKGLACQLPLSTGDILRINKQSFLR
jgi:hypothetical protein